ncbi:flagellar hook-associated protein 1 FlgK [Palleronia marisminoris]|uniref:Flagellar hook-associated protein 1 n=1 Tax=Palleronia marisminoris TaxID=315423 RepID=A0A1Y5SWP7_9RHOB|nr:flagellar hook-associated protein FlgK [Palleronia marisminoris]SFH04787.1 flagellar hook-associated protein 1 FlgK [Palleronia marisminoris]SLN50449.1 Flagellar hook-associated protein 1 [Palleronia marisminoris]
MGISSAIASATSGLFATARSAQTVSDNVANALTPGYAAREVVLATGQFGGVGVATIARRETLSLITDRRMAEADTSGERARSQSLSKVVDLVGSADDSGSLSGRVATFAAGLTAAASLPSSDQRLETVLTSAQALATHLNKAGDGIQAERLAADHAIGDAVEALNQGLLRVEQLNREIARQTASKGDVNTLLDQRRAVIDGISEFIPVREYPRENGRVGLITETGAVLLLDSAAEIGFDKSAGMTPGMMIDDPLSGLTINGRAVDTAREGGPIAGGQIAALFELRDEELPEAQVRLDAFAEELVVRFQDIKTDPSLEAGEAGLFIFSGDATSTKGFSQRLAVNEDKVNPDAGGELWRLRDGLGADEAGPSGDARVLQFFSSGLERASVPANSALGTSSLGIGALADLVVGSTAGAAYRAETDLSYSEGRLNILEEAVLSEGVNTDDEMRMLLLIEQAYAANARVIQTAGIMLDRILEI